MTEMPLAALELGPGAWVACVALGALLGSDATSFPQAMVSRPLVAGTLGGLLFGSAEGGFLVGLALELIILRHPPFGAARYPDPGPAGLVAGAAYAAAGAGGPAAFLAALLTGWAVSWVGSRTVHFLRLGNARLVGDPQELGSPARLERRHRLAIWLDAGRSALLTAAFLLPAIFAARLAASVPAGPAGTDLAPLLAAAGIAAAAGAAGRSLGAERRLWPLMGAGAALAFLGLR